MTTTPVTNDHERLIAVIRANIARATEAGLVAKLQQQLEALIVKHQPRENKSPAKK